VESTEFHHWIHLESNSLESSFVFIITISQTERGLSRQKRINDINKQVMCTVCCVL